MRAMVALAYLLGCGAATTPDTDAAHTDGIDSDTVGTEPVDTHVGLDLGAATLETRPTATACEARSLPAEPTCLGYPKDECTRHADCTAGAGGTCLRGGSYGLYCLCAYDRCQTDVDCGGAEVCACAMDARYQLPANACLPSDCRTDADCASGRCQADHEIWCGTASPDDVLPITSWRCATPEDTCNGDEDCDTAQGFRCMRGGATSFSCSNGYNHACD